MENTTIQNDINYVYLISDGIDSVKIGIAKDYEKRYRELQTANPHKLQMLDAFWCKDRVMALMVETILHNMFEYCRKQGEWFSLEEVIKWYENNCTGEVTRIGKFEWRQVGL